MSDKKVVRLASHEATPFLRENIAVLDAAVEYWACNSEADEKLLVVDVGAGNGRNMDCLIADLHDVPDKAVTGFDLKSDRPDIIERDLATQTIPIKDAAAHIILAQYVFMFFKSEELHHLFCEIDRIAAPGCVMLVELFNAKQGAWHNRVVILETLIRRHFEIRGWQMHSKKQIGHFFLTKPS